MLSSFTAFIKTELRGDKRRFQAAFKAAIACCVAVGIAQYAQLENIYWSMFTVMMIISVPNVGSSLQTSLYWTVATLCGGLLGAFLVAMFGQDIWIYLALQFLVLTLAFYMQSGSFYPFAFYLMGVTMVITGVFQVRNQQNVIMDALMRIANVELGIFSCLLVNLTFWPKKAWNAMLASIGKTLRETAGILAEMGRAASGQAISKPGKDHLSMARSYTRNLNLLAQAAYESEQVSFKQARYAKAILLIERIARATRNAESRLLQTKIAIPANLSSRMTDLCDRMAALLERITMAGPGEPALAVEGRDLVERSRHLIDGVVRWESELLTGGKGKEAVEFHQAAVDLRRIATLFVRVEVLMHGNDGQETKKDEKMVLTGSTVHWGLLPDFRRLLLASCVALCVVLLAIPFEYLHLPFVMASAIAVIWVCRPVVGASWRTATHILSGWLIGGAAALFCAYFLIPHMTLFWHEMVMLMAIFFICGYIANGSERISFLGGQIALTFALAGMMGLAPHTAAAIPGVLLRILGLLLGVVAGGIIIKWCWPVRAIIENLDRGNDRFEKLFGMLRSTRGDRESFERLNEEIVELNAVRYNNAYNLINEALLGGRERMSLEATVYDLLLQEEELVYLILIQYSARIELDDKSLQPDGSGLVGRIDSAVENRLSALGKPGGFTGAPVGELTAELRRMATDPAKEKMCFQDFAALLIEYAVKTEELISAIGGVETMLQQIRVAVSHPRQASR